MYRWLLRLYPASFRNQYGSEMQAVFARQRRDAQTPLALAALWLRVIADSCVTAGAVHWEILVQDLRYKVALIRISQPFRRHGCVSSNFLPDLDFSATGEQSVESDTLVAPITRT
jgi:hypothetical protein